MTAAHPLGQARFHPRLRPHEDFLPESFPQPVEDACGQPCGSELSVYSTSTVCNRSLSTEAVDNPWTTGGYPCGQLGTMSYPRLTVDKRPCCPQGDPQVIHRPTWTVACANTGYPQFPQHLRLRRVISLKKTKKIIGVWTSSQPPGTGPGSHPQIAAVQNRTFPQEASHEVPG